jgi:flagellar basal body-associated protein FliL
MFLTEHEIELRDFITTNVEPVLPRLPLEEEGRGIIKDKIRDEVNEFLKIYKVEGKVQEVYIDSLISS